MASGAKRLRGVEASTSVGAVANIVSRWIIVADPNLLVWVGGSHKDCRCRRHGGTTGLGRIPYNVEAIRVLIDGQVPADQGGAGARTASVYTVADLRRALMRISG